MSRLVARSPLVGGSTVPLLRLGATCPVASLAASTTPIAVGIAAAMSLQPMLIQHRHAAQRIKIANRRRVEMFVATRFHLPTRLRTAAPDVAAEWNYDKNPGYEYPEIIGIGHMAPVWWRCNACGHEYRMSVEKRVVRGGGCERCADAAVQEEKRASLVIDSGGDTLAREMVKGRKVLGTEDLLEGEANAALRSKRSTMLSIRTKY